jgi:hypothetical protein
MPDRRYRFLEIILRFSLVLAVVHASPNNGFSQVDGQTGGSQACAWSLRGLKNPAFPPNLEKKVVQARKRLEGVLQVDRKKVGPKKWLENIAVLRNDVLPVVLKVLAVHGISGTPKGFPFSSKSWEKDVEEAKASRTQLILQKEKHPDLFSDADVQAADEAVAVAERWLREANTQAVTSDQLVEDVFIAVARTGPMSDIFESYELKHVVLEPLLEDLAHVGQIGNSPRNGYRLNMRWGIVLSEPVEALAFIRHEIAHLKKGRSFSRGLFGPMYGGLEGFETIPGYTRFTSFDELRGYHRSLSWFERTGQFSEALFHSHLLKVLAVRVIEVLSVAVMNPEGANYRVERDIDLPDTDGDPATVTYTWFDRVNGAFVKSDRRIKIDVFPLPPGQGSEGGSTALSAEESLAKAIDREPHRLIEEAKSYLNLANRKIAKLSRLVGNRTSNHGPYHRLIEKVKSHLALANRKLARLFERVGFSVQTGHSTQSNDNSP